MALAGLIVVAVSVLVLAWQTHAVVRQGRLASEAARAAASRDIELLQPVLAQFLTFPLLKPHFYEGAPIHGLNDEDRYRAETLAELLGDAIESALENARVASAHREWVEDWRSYAGFLVKRSPALRECVEAHPDWYPRLAEVAGDSERASTWHQHPKRPADPRVPLPRGLHPGQARGGPRGLEWAG